MALNLANREKRVPTCQCPNRLVDHLKRGATSSNAIEIDLLMQ
jgi:hypothetical protein